MTLQSENEVSSVEEIQKVDDESLLNNKQPWLGVIFNSFILSGAGYLYCKRYLRTIVAVLISWIIYAVLYKLIFVESFSSNSLFFLAFCLIIGFKTIISIDTFKIIRRNNMAEYEQFRKSKKDPWLAVFLAIICPGLGFLYLKRWLFFVLFLAFYLWGLDYVYDVINIPDPLITLFFIGAFATFVFWLAIQPSQSIYKMNQFYKFGFITGIVYLMIFLGVFTFVKTVLQVYNISTESMEPTIYAGESVFVDKLAYITKSPKPGDMVVFMEKQASVPYVNRVVAITGQEVCISDEGRLLVDGQGVSYDNIQYKIDYEIFPSLKSRKFLYSGNYIVPRDSYFVVGDNFSNSIDSRHFGPLKKQQIIGQAVRVFE